MEPSRRPGVVFDCNVFLQALANEKSAAAKALDFLEQDAITLFVSEPILHDWHRFTPTVMTTKKKQPRKKVSEEEIDAIVKAQAADDSAWGKPIQVRKGKAAKMLLVREADRVRIAQRFIAGVRSKIETAREADG